MAHKFLEDTPVQGGVQLMWECLITYNARKYLKSTPDDSMVSTIDVLIQADQAILRRCLLRNTSKMDRKCISTTSTLEDLLKYR